MSITYRSVDTLLTTVQSALQAACTWALGDVHVGDVDIDVESGNYQMNTPFIMVYDNGRRKLTKPQSTGCSHRSMMGIRIVLVVSDNSITRGKAVTTALTYMATINQTIYNMGLPSYARDLNLIQELPTRKPTWTIYAIPLPYQIAESEWELEITDLV